MDGHRGGWLARVVLKEICRCVHPYWTSTWSRCRITMKWICFFVRQQGGVAEMGSGYYFHLNYTLSTMFYLCKNFGRFLLSLLRWGEFITPIRAAKVMAIYLDFVKCKRIFYHDCSKQACLSNGTRSQCNLIHSNAYCVMGKWVFY